MLLLLNKINAENHKYGQKPINMDLITLKFMTTSAKQQTWQELLHTETASMMLRWNSDIQDDYLNGSLIIVVAVIIILLCLDGATM